MLDGGSWFCWGAALSSRGLLVQTLVPAKHGRCCGHRGRFQNKVRGTKLTEGPSGDSSRGAYCICLYGYPPTPTNPEMLFELLKIFCCLTKLVQQADFQPSLFLKSILAHQWRLFLIIKRFRDLYNLKKQLVARIKGKGTVLRCL